MSIKQIIQESVNRNPLGLKEALEEELRSRITLALESKINEDAKYFNSTRPTHDESAIAHRYSAQEARDKKTKDHDELAKHHEKAAQAHEDAHDHIIAGRHAAAHKSASNAISHAVDAFSHASRMGDKQSTLNAYHANRDSQNSKLAHIHLK